MLVIKKYEVWLNGDSNKSAYEVAVLLKDHANHQSYETSSYTEKEIVEIPRENDLGGYWEGYIRIDGGADKAEFIEYVGEELSLFQIWFENDPSVKEQLDPDQYVVWASIFGMFDQYPMELDASSGIVITGDLGTEDGSGEVILSFHGNQLNDQEIEGNYDISGYQSFEGETYGMNLNGYFYLQKKQ